MRFLYTIGIYFYSFFIRIASLFNKKAQLFVKGRQGIFSKVQSQINPKDRLIWFHAASLGEFEQGKPIMEECRKDFPNYKILVTFFSPSGYELRKNDEIADYVYYLPLDTPYDMKKWLNIVNPDLVILIKYEFWFNLLHLLHNQNIPIIVVSAVFRSNQIFFKSYGLFMLRALKNIQHFFVQDEQSMQLLNFYGIHQVTLSGDTRFDRVTKLTETVKPLPFLEVFKNDTFTVVAGSTWAKGETFFAQYINETPYTIKFILVPHETHFAKIQQLQKSIQKKSILYSEIKGQNLAAYDVLIIDTVGLLTSIYPYGDIAYVGGAYGSTGIHNILEPATYGKPVFYGPHFEKNQEAKNLVSARGAKVAHDYEGFKNSINLFYEDQERLKTYSQNAQQFIEKNRGATMNIMHYLQKNL
ncbi:MAG: 3-deoxy-D-manno-octulosonic acid transferase [Flavobacteriales bacterium]